MYGPIVNTYVQLLGKDLYCSFCSARNLPHSSYHIPEEVDWCMFWCAFALHPSHMTHCTQTKNPREKNGRQRLYELNKAQVKTNKRTILF